MWSQSLQPWRRCWCHWGWIKYFGNSWFLGVLCEEIGSILNFSCLYNIIQAAVITQTLLITVIAIKAYLCFVLVFLVTYHLYLSVYSYTYEYMSCDWVDLCLQLFFVGLHTYSTSNSCLNQCKSLKHPHTSSMQLSSSVYAQSSGLCACAGLFPEVKCSSNRTHDSTQFPEP